MASGPHVASAATRVAVATALGTAVGIAAAFVLPWQVSVLAGWDTAAGVFLAWVWGTVIRLRGEETAAVATIEDPSRAVVDLILVGASSGCLLGVGFILIKAAHSQGLIAAGLVTLAVASVVISWAVVHTVFMLRYARLYYTGEDGGVDFKQDDPPAYSDFAYLSFTIGMTFQVSDTDLKETRFRRTALGHGVLSYAFATGIVAAAINLVASLSSQ
jgi:uncharacterized membrane protein